MAKVERCMTCGYFVDTPHHRAACLGDPAARQELGPLGAAQIDVDKGYMVALVILQRTMPTPGGVKGKVFQQLRMTAAPGLTPEMIYTLLVNSANMVASAEAQRAGEEDGTEATNDLNVN